MPEEGFVCNDVAVFQVSTLLKANFSTFTLQIFVKYIGIPSSRNAFYHLFSLFAPFVVSIYFFSLMNK